MDRSFSASNLTWETTPETQNPSTMMMKLLPLAAAALLASTDAADSATKSVTSRLMVHVSFVAAVTTHKQRDASKISPVGFRILVDRGRNSTQTMDVCRAQLRLAKGRRKKQVGG